uniref:NADH dehydrogenase subunit 2 n=1 Tax=Corynosoma villosum TaxID=141829 RepID=UPI002E7A5191|nr:NADH dehydrogenase subunit 2 [Corynosoma villosum]WPN89828.1 NADH dehydrogenase subunit 2 [Corynosoma villosum]
MWVGGLSSVVLWSVYLGVVVSGLVSMSYVVVWGALEVGLILTMTYLVWSDDRMSSVFYYYVVQALSSLFMIVGAIVESSVVVMGGLVVKLGLFPAFAWVVSVVWGLGLSWGVLMVLFVQKVIPFVLIARWGWLLDYDSEVFVLLAMMSVVVGSLLMCYGLSVKWLVVLSSLVHTGWLVFVILGSPGSFMFYFMVYGVMLLLFLLAVGCGEDLGVVGMLVVLSSVPPMIGFLFKFYSLGLMGESFVVFLVVGLSLVVGAVVGYFINLVWGMMAQVSGLWGQVGGNVVVPMGLLVLFCGFVYL